MYELVCYRYSVAENWRYFKQFNMIHTLGLYDGSQKKGSGYAAFVENHLTVPVKGTDSG